MKFCVELQKSPSQTLEILKTVYGESAMGKGNVMLCDKRIREGREDMKDDARQVAPVTKRTDENDARVRELERSDSRLSCRMIANG